MPRERLQAHGSHLQARALRWALRSLARDGKSRAGDVPPESVSPRNDRRDRAQVGGTAEGGHAMTAHTKACSICGVVKSAGEFWVDTRLARGSRAACADCSREDTKKRRAANPSKHRREVARWRKANPAKRIAQNKRYRLANHDKTKAQWAVQDA